MRTSTMLLCLAAGTSSAPAAGQAPIVWSRYQLPNGLEVVLAPDGAANEVSIEWWVRAGGRDEAPGRFGLAHFFEHAMPYGSGVIRTGAGRRVYDSLRTDNNAKTRFDYTRFYTRLKPEGLDFFLLVASDRMRSDPAVEFTPERVETHRQNVAAEIQRAATGTWGWPIKSALHAGTFGRGHPYGHHLYGSAQETGDASPDDMIRWFRAHIRPEYTTLFVVGKFDTTTARAAISRAFGAIPGGTRPPRPHPLVPGAVASTDTVTVAAATSYTFLSWPVAEAASAERAPLTLLARILSDRLARNRPTGVASAEVETEFFELAGRFTMSAAFPSTAERARPTITAWLQRELADVVARGVTDAEVRKAGDEEAAALDAALQELGWESSRTELLGEGLFFTGDAGAFLPGARPEHEVTPAQVHRSAVRWLAHPGLLLMVRGSER